MRLRAFATFFLTFSLAAPAWAHPSGGGHIHSTSMGDSSGGGTWNSGVSQSGMGQMPQTLMGGGAMQAPPPPPPPPPPPLAQPLKVQTLPAVSRVKALGKPGSPVSGEDRQIRNITGIYEDGQVVSQESEDVVRIRKPRITPPRLDFIDTSF